MKNLIVYLFVALGSLPILTHAQDTSFERFRQEAEEYSSIYSGKTAFSYNRLQYNNHPYWENEEYRNGTLCYQGRIYNEVPMRYDLYRNELNILSPQKIGVNADMRKVDYFILDQVKFVPHEEGYQLILHDSKHIKLTSLVKCSFGNDVQEGTYSLKNFALRQQYTLTIDGKTYDVRKKKSFIKCFPAYKKQLKKYAKENALNFSTQRRQSLTAMAQYAESLINADHHEK